MDDYQEDMTLADEEQEKARQEQYRVLDALGAEITQKRKEAVAYLSASGIREIWAEDLAYYDGLETSSSEYTKPTTSEGRVVVKEDNNQPVFVNITQPYCDMFSGRASDILLPNDDRPFGLLPTPIPDVDKYKDSDELHTFPNGAQRPAKDIIADAISEAEAIAKRSETRIWDWLCESNWHGEVRQVLEDMGKIGTGCIKGPFPAKKNVKKLVQQDGMTVIQMTQEIVPKSKRIRVQDLFPDPACGENIHNGSYIFEREYMTPKQLGLLKGTDFLDDQIDLCLEEGPDGKDQDDRSSDDKTRVFTVWYFNGIVTAKEMSAAGCDCAEDVPAIITIVNDRVIKAAVSPLDSGSFPYDVVAYKRRDGAWFGTGLARIIRTPQRMLNAATRSMLNNAGLSSMPIWFMRRAGIFPADGTNNYNLTPGKGFLVDDSVDSRAVRDSVFFQVIPNVQEKFAAIVAFAMDMAERLTNMPLIMQGQQGSASETVGGMQILQQNSGSVLRRVAKQFDDYITEPHMQRYYEYLLIYGDNPDEKGDSVIDARGSTVLFERDAQDQSIMQLAGLVKDPAFGINPKKWIVETLKAQKLDPSRFQYSPEELQQIQEQQSNQQPDPRIAGQIQVANIRTQGDLQKAQLNQQSDMAELQLKQQIEGANIQQKSELAQMQMAHERAMKEMDLQIAQMEYEVKKALLLEEGKIKLADTTMKLSTQEKLSKPVEVMTPPTEPSQHAPNGRSFQE